MKVFSHYVVAEIELLEDFHTKGGFNYLDDPIVYGLLITFELLAGVSFERRGYKPNPLPIFQKKFKTEYLEKKLKMNMNEVEKLIHGQYETEDFMKKFKSNAFVKAMKPFLDNTQCYLDLYIGNLMYRGKTLIVNDPLF